MGQRQAEAVIGKTGTDAADHVAPELESWAKANNVNVLVQPSYDALAKVIETGEQRKVAALIHITC